MLAKQQYFPIQLEVDLKIQAMVTVVLYFSVLCSFFSPTVTSAELLRGTLEFQITLFQRSI